MGAIATIAINDGENPPVSHSFLPVYVRNEDGAQVAFYRESLADVPLDAQPTLKLTQKRMPSGVYRFSGRIEIPVMESVSGQNSAGYTAAPKVAYKVTAEIVVYSPERSTPQQRRNSRYLIWNLLTQAPMTDMIETGVSPT